MSRINVEDSLWSDPRFLKLCARLGDEYRAVGMVVVAWKLAQKHYCPDRKPIPTQDFLDSGLSEEIITVGLAKKTEAGIHMRGCETHFDWWFQRAEASKKGGQANASRLEAIRLAGRLSTDSRNKPSSSFSLRKEINTSSLKQVEKSRAALENTPTEQATLCFKAIQKFGRDDSKSLAEFVGPDLYEKIARGVGWNSIRETPRDQWAVPNLAKKL